MHPSKCSPVCLSHAPQHVSSASTHVPMHPERTMDRLVACTCSSVGRRHASHGSLRGHRSWRDAACLAWPAARHCPVLRPSMAAPAPVALSAIASWCEKPTFGIPAPSESYASAICTSSCTEYMLWHGTASQRHASRLTKRSMLRRMDCDHRSTTSTAWLGARGWLTQQ